MEPTVNYQNTIPQSMPQMQMDAQSGVPDPSVAQMQQMVADSGNNTLGSCFRIVGFLLFVVLFILFGNTLLSYFHLQNVYYFIVTFLIALIIFVVGMVAVQVSIKEPKDLLTIITDRLKN